MPEYAAPPPVPWGRGPRRLQRTALLVAFPAGVLLLVFGYFVGGALLAYHLGLIGTQQATVTETELHEERDPDETWFRVEWPGHANRHTARVDEELFAVGVGDRVTIAPLPLGEPYFVDQGAGVFDWVGNTGMFAGGLFALWWGSHRLLTVRRLVRGAGRAEPMRGELGRRPQAHVRRVTIFDRDTSEGKSPQVQLVLPKFDGYDRLPSTGMCTVWPARWSRLRRCPAGPWVVLPDHLEAGAFAATGPWEKRPRA